MIKKKPKTIDDVLKKMDRLAIGTDTAIGNLAIMVQKGFMETAKQSDLLDLIERVSILEKEVKGMHGNFDMIFQQLKDIHEEIKNVDTRTDVIDLQIRLSKLEKKIKT